MENGHSYVGVHNIDISSTNISEKKLEEVSLDMSLDQKNNIDAFSCDKMKLESKSIKCENDFELQVNRENSIYVIRDNFGDLLDSVQSILTVDSNIEDMAENDFNIKKNCIISFLCIFKNLITNHLQLNEGDHNFESCFTSFEECVSNFLSGNMGNVLVEALMDIFLPEKNTDIYEDLYFENEFEHYCTVPSILYFCLVIMAFNDLEQSENFYINVGSGFNRENTLLLPISKLFSELECSWLLCQNTYMSNKCFQSGNPLGISNLNKERNASIFRSEYIPQIIARLINYLRRNAYNSNNFFSKKDSAVREMLINNPFSGDSTQSPFYIGRILEICLSKFQQIFISHFLQCKGPLVLLPYIHYSSIQDFFFRFFGFIGMTIQPNNLYNPLSTSFLEVEYSENDQECVIDEIEAEKFSIEDQFSNIGISSLIYDWSVKNNFIKYLISPISFGFFNHKSQYEFMKVMNLDINSIENQHLISGVVEFITRLVEYLKPEQSGLPASMTSVGLLWLLYTGEINDNCYFNTFISQFRLNNIDEHSLLTYEKAYSFSTGIEHSSSFNQKDTQEITTGDHIVSSVNKDCTKDKFNFSNDHSNDMLRSEAMPNEIYYDNLNNNEDFGPVNMNINNKSGSIEKDGINHAKTCRTDGRHHLEKTLQLLYGLFVESSLIQHLCEYILFNNTEEDLKESTMILKLRILNLLEVIINLAFSTSSNIIGCLRSDIMNGLSSYLMKFCDSLLLKYRDSELLLNETGYLVSKLTIIKLILFYDETRNLINSLSLDFWDWLLILLIKKREISLISVQCKTIFELGIQYGSYLTLEILFCELKLVEKLSKFIYDGTDLNGFNIEDSEISNKEVKNKRPKKRIFGSIKGFFMILGQLYDSLIQTILSCDSEMYRNIKIELIANIIISHLNKYEEVDEETKEIINSTIRNEYESFPIQDKNKEIELDPFVIIDSQRILSLLLALSCCTKCHKTIKEFRNNYEFRSMQSDQNISSVSVNRLFDDNCIQNIENCSLSPNSNKEQNFKSQIDDIPLDISQNCEFVNSRKKLISDLIKIYYTEEFLDLVKCCEKCECPEWSFFNVLFKLRKEKNHSSEISIMPILPLEESKRIRDSRKRQMKLYTSIQKV